MDEKLKVLESSAGCGHVYFASNACKSQRQECFQAKWNPLRVKKTLLSKRARARSDAKPVSTFAERALDAGYTGRIAFRELARPHDVAALLERLRSGH
jgi:hypothetical protein